ncbi:MAG: methyltransferase domain-containing protein [Bryobacterales bacterium]|nr:methyltransferase domain-containing protein [Bryobacterales bacterium]
MLYRGLVQSMPQWLRRWVLHFETEIEQAAATFSQALPAGSRVLDAGAGELRYAQLFRRHKYLAVDLAIGDPQWDYGKLDCVADLSALPLADGVCDACVNIVTLEHVAEPAQVVRELARVLRPGGHLLLVAPMEWEVHQAPHDYFRYTRHGLTYLLERAGFGELRIEPVGGFFRLLARRMLNGLQFLPGPLVLLGAVLLGPAALVLPLLDGLDKKRDFTLGYICRAVRQSAR